MKNLTAKDKFNAKNNGKSFETILGKKVKIEGCMFYEDNITNKETGEVQKGIINAVKIDGEIYCSPSQTLHSALESLLEYMAEEKMETCDIKVVNGSSSKGRKFLTIELV